MTTTFDAQSYRRIVVEDYESMGTTTEHTADKMPTGYYVVNTKADYALRFRTREALADYVKACRDDVMAEPLDDGEIIVVIEPVVVYPDDIIA